MRDDLDHLARFQVEQAVHEPAPLLLAAPRRWKFDFANPALMVALEVEGGTWTRGRHTSGKGYAADCEKYSTAAVMGWRVLRFTTDQVKSGMALRMLQQAIGRAA
ncbi:hypothetical protein ACW9FB_11820 [Ralstonia mannitolilytica]